MYTVVGDMQNSRMNSNVHKFIVLKRMFSLQARLHRKNVNVLVPGSWLLDCTNIIIYRTGFNSWLCVSLCLSENLS